MNAGQLNKGSKRHRGRDHRRHLKTRRLGELDQRVGQERDEKSLSSKGEEKLLKGLLQ